MHIRTCYIFGVALASAVLLSSCDRLGFVDLSKEAASQDAESRATGSACRYAGRALEDCFIRNAEAKRDAVFSGWKEMDGYMRENKIEVIKPESALLPAQENGLITQEIVID